MVWNLQFYRYFGEGREIIEFKSHFTSLCMSNEVLLEQIPGSRIPNLSKSACFLFSFSQPFKKKGKKKAGKKKARCLKYFHMANWFMARATIYNPRAFREVNEILTVVPESFLLPELSPLGCSTDPSSESSWSKLGLFPIYQFLCIH